MEGDKLNSLNLLAVETDFANKTNFDAIVDDFVTQKRRGKPMSTRHYLILNTIFKKLL